MGIRMVNGEFGYEHKLLFKGVDFQVEQGEMVVILGPNGSGKSSFLRCLLGINSLRKGQVTYKDIEMMTRIPLVGYVPQGWGRKWNYKVEEMVVMGRATKIGVWAQPGDKDYGLAKKVLRKVGLKGLEKREFNSLSGGEQQLVILARALVSESKILIMDEPTSDLDFGNQYRVLELLKKLVKKERYGVVWTTHQPIQALRYADKVLLMYKDERSKFGAVDQVLTSKALQELYDVDLEMVEVGRVGRKVMRGLWVKGS